MLNEVRRCFLPSQWFTDQCESYDEYRGDELMWVYRQTEDNRWMVGYFFPDRTWFTESLYGGGAEGKAAAAARVRWLNGGEAA